MTQPSISYKRHRFPLNVTTPLTHQFGVEGGSGLVEEHQAGADGEGTGDGDALLLAAGKAVRQVIGMGGEPYDLEQLQCHFAGLGLGNAINLNRGLHDVFEHGEVGEEVEGLCQVAEFVSP